MNKYPTYLTVKDHSVSGEEFQLVHNMELDMLETFPQPEAEKLSDYYKRRLYFAYGYETKSIRICLSFRSSDRFKTKIKTY